jgi:hopene-associated glycosyltransferase HpnB
MIALLVVGLVALAAWLYLLLARGGFWQAAVEKLAPRPARWPAVVAVVPARDEAAVIGRAISSLLGQEYPGSFRVVLVDDHSSDGTADAARVEAMALRKADRLTVVEARPLPAGWTGKLWALAEGVRAVEEAGAPPELLLVTDADIEHHPANLARLVARLEADGLDLASLMVKLNCRSRAERALVPAFVFFFAMLYPFRWAADPQRSTAAAAGGCVLMRRQALERIGGYAAIRGALIDDCALARAIKPGGRIWLGLSRETRSLRAYPRLADIRHMVVRTAYTQLGYSPLMLIGTVLGLGLVFLAPPVIAIAGFATGHAGTGWTGLLAWAAMAIAYAPMLRFYGRSLLWAPLLPGVATLYLAFTIDSARRHWRGRGGEWKGRVQLGTEA